ncbi:MAG TPA: DUF1440 domain-containing protein [Bryobacteraceae bacterium]|nr:DUF1440 domain-containing protein [Bryobacteraceae bacterium]
MRRNGLWTAVAAGVAGGLVGSVAMGLAHAGLAKVVGEKTRGGPEDATVLTAERLLGRELELEEKAVAGSLVHLLFGSAMGAAYGAATAVVPKAASGAGLPLGAALYFGAHGYGVPKAGLGRSPLDQPLPGEFVEFAAHLVYGLVTDGIRRAITSKVS